MKLCILEGIPGIDPNRPIRVTPDNQASIYDIIELIGQRSNPHQTWSRIKKNTELSPYCSTYKFAGKGNGDAPTIDCNGIFLLINFIPGKKAEKIRLECAKVLVRFMGGDESMIVELQQNAMIAAKNPISSQAFFGASNLNSKCKVTQVLPKYYLYVRAFNSLIADLQNSENESEKIVIFDENIIKFGITHNLKSRGDSYGKDHGFFAYSISVPNKEIADEIENIFRAKLKSVCLSGRFEYLYVDKLIGRLWNLPTGKKPSYKEVVDSLYAMIIGELHTIYPELRKCFGKAYLTELQPNIKALVTQNEGELENKTKVTELTIDSLPAYQQLFPHLTTEYWNNENTESEQIIEIEKTRREIELSKEETNRIVEMEKEKQSTKLEIEKELTKRENEKELTKRENEKEKELTKRENAKTEQLRLQLEILRLEKVTTKPIATPESTEKVSTVQTIKDSFTKMISKVTTKSPSPIVVQTEKEKKIAGKDQTKAKQHKIMQFHFVLHTTKKQLEYHKELLEEKLEWYTNHAYYHLVNKNDKLAFEGYLQTEHKENVNNMPEMMGYLIPDIEVSEGGPDAKNTLTLDYDIDEQYRVDGPWEIKKEYNIAAGVFNFKTTRKTLEELECFLEEDENINGIFVQIEKIIEPTVTFKDFESHLRFYGFRDLPPIEKLKPIFDKFGLKVIRCRPCLHCRSPGTLSRDCCDKFHHTKRGSCQYIKGIAHLTKKICDDETSDSDESEDEESSESGGENNDNDESDDDSSR